MSEDTTRFVGMDVHKETIVVAVARQGTEPPESWGTFANTEAGVRKLVARLGSTDWVFCTYEAGPTGYALLRQLQGLGVVLQRHRTLADPDKGRRPGENGPPRCDQAGAAAAGR